MAGKRSKRLVREDEPSQRTEKGLEIPVPKRDQFFEALNKASKKEDSGRGKPSRSGPRKP
jgi:hypothetical protein